MNHGEDTLKVVPSALSADCPPFNDPLFRVSEGRPPRSGSETEGLPPPDRMKKTGTYALARKDGGGPAGEILKGDWGS